MIMFFETSRSSAYFHASFISVQFFRVVYTVAANNGLLLILLSNLLMIHWRCLVGFMMADSIVVPYDERR